MSPDSYKVGRIDILQKPREDEARKILETVAKQVRPIMRKRKWKVKCLTEFLPSNPMLFGLNHGAGEKIEIRLRRPGWGLEFYPYEFILDIMLHELCHNVHYAHDAAFFRLWEEIRRENHANVIKKTLQRNLSEGSKGPSLGRSLSEGKMNKNLERSVSDSWMKYGHTSSSSGYGGGNPWNDGYCSIPRHNSLAEDTSPLHIFIFILAFFVLFILR